MSTTVLYDTVKFYQTVMLYSTSLSRQDSYDTLARAGERANTFWTHRSTPELN